MPFVKHTETGKSFTPRVSLSQNGLLGFSDAATRKYLPDELPYVVLYYNPEERIVGIRPTKDGDEQGAIKIRMRDQGAYVAAKSFMGFFEIGLEATTTYDLGYDPKEDLLVFDLKRGRERKGRITIARAASDEEKTENKV